MKNQFLFFSFLFFSFLSNAPFFSFAPMKMSLSKRNLSAFGDIAPRVASYHAACNLLRQAPDAQTAALLVKARRLAILSTEDRVYTHTVFFQTGTEDHSTARENENRLENKCPRLRANSNALAFVLPLAPVYTR